MAKGRMINRKIATDARFNSLSRNEQWLFMRMLPFADDEGKLPGNLTELRLLTIPGERIKDFTIEKVLKGIERSGLVRIDIGVVIQYVGWRKNQKLGHRPASSLYPDIVKDTGKGQERSPKVATTELNLTELNITKREYGEYKNILLTDDQNKKLKNKFPTTYNYQIKNLDEYIETSGKKYKNHYLVILKWADKEKPIKKEPTGYIYKCPECNTEKEFNDRRDYHYRCEENKCQQIPKGKGLVGYVLEFDREVDNKE